MKLLRNFALSLVLAVGFASLSSAQAINTEKGKVSDETMVQIHKIDLLNQLLPLILTRAQINDKLLPAIEKSRGKWKELLTEEDNILGKLGPKVDETVTNAIDKQVYPPREFLTEIREKTRSMQLKRTILQIQLVADLDVVVKETLTTGQMKALLGSFDSRFIDPTKKPEELSEDTKRQFFIRNVLLDPLARELLIELEKKMPPDEKKE